MSRSCLALALLLHLGGGLLGQQPRQDRDRPSSAWQPVTVVECPAPCGVWTRREAAHLLRRAAFSAPPREIERFVEMGFPASLDELINFERLDDSGMEAGLAARDYPFTRFNDRGRMLPNQAGMRQWWLYRMAHSRRQLLEKMTYFWHDHFATSVTTVRQVTPGGDPFMMAQNRLLREYALGNFKEMVHQIARDPAMLVWLDNRSNVAESPNENWARELMELFTMGEGNYTEEDIQEAARAFTGWGLDRRSGAFRFHPALHDYGQKTVLGVTGALDGDDIIDIIFEQPETAEFIASKLWAFFVYPDPDPEIVTGLADVFRSAGYELKPLLRAIFEHPEFHSVRAYRALIKSPVELAVGTFRELELADPDFLHRLMRFMGQDLFAPPDVGGWTSGRGWINTSTILGRYNFYNLLIATRNENGILYVDVDRIIQENQLSDSFQVVRYFLDRLVQSDFSQDTLYALEQYLRTDESGRLVEFDISDPVTVDKKVRGLLYLILVLPVHQLN